MKIVWKVLAWIFVACGLFTYLSAWGSLWFGWRMLGATPEDLFYDAVSTGIFGIFFLVWGKYGSNK